MKFKKMKFYFHPQFLHASLTSQFAFHIFMPLSEMKNIHMKIILSVLISHSTHIIEIAALGIGSRELQGDIHFFKATMKSQSKSRGDHNQPRIYHLYLIIISSSHLF